MLPITDEEEESDDDEDEDAELPVERAARELDARQLEDEYVGS